VVVVSGVSVALYRGRFDPPGRHHVAVIEALLARFDRIVVVPFGAIDGRAVDENVAPVYRARLIDLAFGSLSSRVEVDLRDLEHLTTTRASELDQELRQTGVRVFHVVEHENQIDDRRRLPADAAVVIVAPEGVAVDAPGAVIVNVGADVAGSVMRQRAFAGNDIADVVPAVVADDIRRRGLYRSNEPRTRTRLRLPSDPRVFVSMDERNPRAHIIKQRLGAVVTDDINAACAIVVIGGDGSMLHAIQTWWRRRLPFIGLNAGHLGFLLNDVKTALPEPELVDGPRAAERLLSSELVCHHLPMLYVELLKTDGTWTSGLTFNDAWVERASGQSAWVEITVDGHVRLEKLVCDGVLVSTAAGSTAYARSMGATPLLADTPAWLLVGSNVMHPIRWKSALLAKDSVVEVKSLHVEKRPLVGFLHGQSRGEVTVMRARLSRVASAELCFLGVNDLTEKIARVQFPAGGELD
jgi:NAD kinase/nicotinic acid mononucleotide adenylyltransferase